MNNKKTIIFDLGGVLIDWNPRYFYKNVFKDDKKMEDFLSTACNSAWIVKMDEGVLIKDNIAQGQKEHPKYAKELAMYDEGWSKMIGGYFKDSVEILENLKAKKYPLYALTNWSAEKFPWARKHFAFLNLFDGIVVSGEEFCRKPFPKLYNILLLRYNLEAKNCIFIDDNKDNVIAARNLGMKGVQFTSAKELKDILQQEGLL